jgi:D-alanyl-D-alanine dipeptidase
VSIVTKLSGFIAPDADKAYFFSGDQYVRYDVAADAVDDGYPRSIGDDWPGVFHNDIDAVLPWPDGSLYFFRGSEYIKYDLASSVSAEGYPRPIAGNWPGVFESKIDAAVLWSGGEVVYFFAGSEYVRYDVAADAADDGYPLSITGNWPGLFETGLDAALLWPSGNLYFFSADQYSKYDTAADTTADGYPQPIAGNWPGLPITTNGASQPTAAGDAPTSVEKPGGGRIQDKSEPAQADRVTVTGAGGAQVVLHRLAAKQWARLIDAARAGGIATPLLLPVSGYRSVASQQVLWKAALAKYGSEAEARKWVAKPGGSAHHSGRAVDCWLGTATNSENVGKQRQTAAWKWLVANAERFGFYPYDAEPWHWEYNPPAH